MLNRRSLFYGCTWVLAVLLNPVFSHAVHFPRSIAKLGTLVGIPRPAPYLLPGGSLSRAVQQGSHLREKGF